MFGYTRRDERKNRLFRRYLQFGTIVAERERESGSYIYTCAKIINFQLRNASSTKSIINYQLSIINYQLSITNYQLRITGRRMATRIFNFQLRNGRTFGMGFRGFGGGFRKIGMCLRGFGGGFRKVGMCLRGLDGGFRKDGMCLRRLAATFRDNYQLSITNYEYEDGN
jgi:hypothetical protein